jgi:hypothetical protein
MPSPRRRRRRNVPSYTLPHPSTLNQPAPAESRPSPGDANWHPSFAEKDARTHKFFPTIADFVSYVDKASQGASRDNSRSNEATMSWSLGVSYTGALKMAEVGWPEGAQMVDQLVDKVESVINATLPDQRQRLRPAIAGGRVSVPAFLAGQPLHFLTLKREAATVKTITLNVSLSISCAVSAEHAMRRGVAICALVKCLERRRVRCQILVQKTCDCGSELPGNGWYVGLVQVKDAGDKLHPHMVAFAIAHTAFVRRLGFAMCETASKESGRPVPDGYGMPAFMPIEGAVNLETVPCSSDDEMIAFVDQQLKTILRDA